MRLLAVFLLSLRWLLPIVRGELAWFDYRKSPYVYPPVLPGSEGPPFFNGRGQLVPALVGPAVIGYGGALLPGQNQRLYGIDPFTGLPINPAKNFYGIDPYTGLSIRRCRSATTGLRSAQPGKNVQCIEYCLNYKENSRQCQLHDDCPGQHLCFCACDQCKSKLCVAAHPTNKRCTLSSPCEKETHTCRNGRCWEIRQRTESPVKS